MVASLFEEDRSVGQDLVRSAPGGHGLCRAAPLAKSPMARMGRCLDARLGPEQAGLSSVRAPAPPGSTYFEQLVMPQGLKRGPGTLRPRSEKNRRGPRPPR